jgi:predicted TIM-barrel fold metal-dependent hydrolase
VSTKTVVIDAHAHLGGCCVFGITTTEDQLVRRIDENEVDITIVQPYPGNKEPGRAHDQIAELCSKHSGRFRGMASLSPHTDHDFYRSEVERCVKELNFVGLKLHTIGHGVNPMSEDGDLVFKTGYELGIPVMVHTGPGIPFALPALCIPAAQKYPGLKIILAHAGWGIFSAEAQVAASVCGNLYLETSWCLGEDIRWMISTIGSARVMMGADLPSNVPVEIAKYRALDLDETVYNQVIGTTATEVFGLSSMIENLAEGTSAAFHESNPAQSATFLRR